jgi:beta-N-acetylhexosaminidase
MRAGLIQFLLATLVGALCTACAALSAPKRPPLPLGELLLVGFHGTEVEGNEEVRRLVCDLKVGGVILFEPNLATGAPRNIVSPEQLHRLTTDLQALAGRCAGRPLFIATDAEGGQVMRLSPRVGYRPSASASELGEAGDTAATELQARRIGATLREAGINWNLAPVVDVAVNPFNPAVVALGRTFSADPREVIAHARAFVHGMHAAGVLTALKHFPGHGSSWRDSHAGFTDVSETADLKVELAPYRALITEGLADSVMTAHVFNRGLDPWDPATLSRYTVNRILRRRFHYEGVVVSDDLLMGAIVQKYGLEEAAVKALDAGVDVLLISQNTKTGEPLAAERVIAAIQRALEEGWLSRSRVTNALHHVTALRSRLPPSTGQRAAPSGALWEGLTGCPPDARSRRQAGAADLHQPLSRQPHRLVRAGHQRPRPSRRSPPPQGMQEALHIGAFRQGILCAAPGARQGSGGASERDGLIETAPGGEADRQSPVERVSRGGRVQRRDGKRREVQRVDAVAQQGALLRQRDHHVMRTTVE